ncbi:MAG: hypothetical protein RMY28_020445 [Nostoc sp. ChiSLP01]|nr:hypothetical protein [Nostoc sp. CmiSLP01]MDZ8288335.1 hypothetical protein [Nostoc sp. ChiSLP01]
MSSTSCSSCVVILNHQQKENISHQKQCQDVPVNDTKNTGENCTVVENGRVVVKPIQCPKD